MKSNYSRRTVFVGASDDFCAVGANDKIVMDAVDSLCETDHNE